MNPYATLGVSTLATDREIKNAYRRLVKLYHPDGRSPQASHEQIAAINDAYDILSDPEKRARYDRGFAEIFIEQPEEDPVEVYKREFKRKRAEREKREREEEFENKKAAYAVMRYLHMPILVFACALVLYDMIALGTFTVLYILLLYNAAYICYQTRYEPFAYKLCQYTFFLFAMIVFYLIASSR